MSAQVAVKLSQKALRVTLDALDLLADKLQRATKKKGVTEDELSDLYNDLGFIAAVRADFAAKAD